MKAQSKHVLAIALCLTGSFTGCNSDDGKNSVVPDQNLKAYQDASCQFGYEEGGAIDSYEAARTDVESLSFGKQIDLAPIHAVETASAKNTVDFFNTKNVTIYQVPKSVSSCNMFSSLPLAHYDFLSFWDTASGSSSEKGTIVGMYVDKGSSDVASTYSGAQIGVREDANRWVVVHEFMHHGFELQASKSGPSHSQLKNEMQSKLNDFKTAADLYDSYPTTDSLKRVATTYVSLSQVVRKFLLAYSLEEVTIETYLQKNHANFTVMPMMKESSDSYISGSASTARGLIDSINKVAPALRSELSGQSMYDLYDQVQAEELANSNLRSQISLATSETGNYLQQKLTSAKAPELAAGPVIHCSHEDDADQARKDISRVMRHFGDRLNR